MKDLHDAALRGAIEVDQEIAAAHQVQPREGRVASHILTREDAQVPDAFGDPIASDAQDVAIAVYGQVWLQATAYDPARGSVWAWLLMLCRSRAIDLMRQERLRCVLEGMFANQRDVMWLPTEAPVDHAPLHRALAALRPVRRHLITLAFFRGYSHVEIAHALGIPLGTVKSHLRRTLAELRQSLVNAQASAGQARPPKATRSIAARFIAPSGRQRQQRMDRAREDIEIGGA